MQSLRTLRRVSRPVITAALLLVAAGHDARAQEKVTIAAFQGSFVNFPMYVAKDLKLFEKHGVNVELVYATGGQVTTMLVSGATDMSGVSVENGLAVAAKGQDVQLLVLNQTTPPFTLIVRNEINLPNAGKPYPEMLKDLKNLKIGISNRGASSDHVLQFLIKEAGLDPKYDVQIIAAGEPPSQVASLKNAVIDGAFAFEPTQSQAISGLKIAKSVLDIQGGEGPEIFREYAYNGLFARRTFIASHGDAIRRIVAAIVEAEEMINDPAKLDAVTAVAVSNMRGMDPDLLRAYLNKHRGIFVPIASRKAIGNVLQLLSMQGRLDKPLTYDGVVATDFMPKSFGTQKTN
jgi:ABC-type nitrate/sulfonate/bicarbonate transport system substrate-binding protein